MSRGGLANTLLDKLVRPLYPHYWFGLTDRLNKRMHIHGQPKPEAPPGFGIIKAAYTLESKTWVTVVATFDDAENGVVKGMSKEFQLDMLLLEPDVPRDESEDKPLLESKSVYLDIALWDRLGEIAKELKRSRNKLVAGVLKDWVAAFKPNPETAKK